MAVPFLTHVIDAQDKPSDRIDQEWLLTNGTGAFAMGTVPGVNTRRYHGLLVASLRPPVARVAVLNQVLEQIVVVGPTKASSTLELTSCEFRKTEGGAVFSPQGDRALMKFERGACIAWTYRIRSDEVSGDIEVVRELNLHWKQQAATLRYQVRRIAAPGRPAPVSMTLRLAPMLTLRDFHQLLHSQTLGAPEMHAGADSVTVQRGGAAAPVAGSTPALTATIRSPGSRFSAAPQWWYRVYYPLEEQRGQDSLEDYFLPGWFEIALDPVQGGQATLTVALGDQPAPPLPANDAARDEHLAPVREKLAPIAAAANPPGATPDSAAVLTNMLALAADDFVVDRWIGQERLATIIAGYPWFADWGRDTFIALPGLLLATGRFAEARSTLRAFAQAIRDGLVPNVFDDYNASAAHYNTVDASLWFVHAGMEYVQASGDRLSWDQWLGGACMGVVDAYIKGTNPSDMPEQDRRADAPLIRMTGDGLITAGSARTQLTWMDAACDGVVFTPRAGKAVEINALWYHVLTGMAEMLGPEHQATADHYRKLTARISRAFSRLFWCEEHGYLYDHAWVDVQGQEQVDRTCRPNQILAVSLPHSPLPRKRQQQVLDMVRRRLWTPVGLRTLPTDDPQFHGRYEGSPRARDEAYHQGTVWPWLMGPFAEAILRLGRFSSAARGEARNALAGLVDHMSGPGLGQLHEIFDGDAPHQPRGCIAQAWSVAEVIRVLALIARVDEKR